ncbi:hypothetical protein HAX54_036283 [Datura stramonium]|uniref:Uncharacterized protein n=1 Tax=Datura stramonium TaxID=4076 RepID=A0ABS8RMN1_DATST|nr:hypothetical protein [Datura stramonium]
MANRALGEEEAPFEVARELLIAISNLLPDIVRVENSCNSNENTVASRDRTEDFSVHRIAVVASELSCRLSGVIKSSPMDGTTFPVVVLSSICIAVVARELNHRLSVSQRAFLWMENISSS